MRVKCFRRGQPDTPFPAEGFEAEVQPYTNKITGQSDPVIMFTPPL